MQKEWHERAIYGYFKILYLFCKILWTHGFLGSEQIFSEERCLKKDTLKMSNAIFIVSSETACPYYDVGDELKVENGTLSISSYKPACLVLAEKIKKDVSASENGGRFVPPGTHQLRPGAQQSNFDCGGCTGMIRYKYKQEKAYATLQMKLLMEAEERRKREHLAKYYHRIRSLDLFESLEDDVLKDFTNFLEFRTVLPQKVLLEKGAPGTYLYIIISGEVDVVEESGRKVSRMQTGEIFGEMSLLSGEPYSYFIHSVTVVQVAQLSIKNFRQILKQHPPLQIFLFKLLIDRVQMAALKSGNIASGMSGDLAEVPPVDLMQLLNSSQKTGLIDITGPDGSARVCFHEGEIVDAQLNALQGKEAVFAVLGIKEGQFVYRRMTVDEARNPEPIGAFMSLIMEGLQRIDEHDQP